MSGRPLRRRRDAGPGRAVVNRSAVGVAVRRGWPRRAQRNAGGGTRLVPVPFGGRPPHLGGRSSRRRPSGPSAIRSSALRCRAFASVGSWVPRKRFSISLPTCFTDTAGARAAVVDARSRDASKFGPSAEATGTTSAYSRRIKKAAPFKNVWIIRPLEGPWRRGGDSNPRWACTHAAFRVRYNQPLCHLSARCLVETGGA